MSEPLTVPRLQRPDVVDFRRRFEEPRQPVVITGAMDNWKAMDRWSQDYFAEHLGDQQLPAMTAQEDPPENGPLTPDQLMRLKMTKVTIREYLDEVNSGKPLRRYVSGMPLRRHLPALLDDIESPEYREEGSNVSPRIWLGGRLIGPLHYDPSNNLHGIVSGFKRFTLFHPRELGNLYPCSMLSVIPQMSRASLSQPDYDRFPRLRKARSVAIDLKPGDLLFLPAGWWHQVTSMLPTISIDFPWRDAPMLGRPFLRLLPSRWLSSVRGRLGRSKR